MSTIHSATRGFPVDLQSTVTTGNGIVIAVSRTFRNHLLTVKTSAGISAGKIQWEGADTDDYAGTWIALAAEIVLAASKEVEQSISGMLPAFIRARVSTDVVGGTVSVSYTGANN